ncbi:MAG TPA: hypothetical protein VH681_05635 [Nitrospiraceae bacterium]|jgi:hypothetical protein
MGRSEQVIRIALGAVLIGFSFQEKTTVIMAMAGYLVGTALILTALARNQTMAIVEWIMRSAP